MSITTVVLFLCFCALFYGLFALADHVRQRRRINAAIRSKPPQPDYTLIGALYAGAVAASRRTPPPLPTDENIELPRFLK